MKVLLTVRGWPAVPSSSITFFLASLYQWTHPVVAPLVWDVDVCEIVVYDAHCLRWRGFESNRNLPEPVVLFEFIRILFIKTQLFLLYKVQ